MKKWIQRWLSLILTITLLASAFPLSGQIALAEETTAPPSATTETSDVPSEHTDLLPEPPDGQTAGQQAFLAFFGEDGVDDCLQPETLEGYIQLLENGASADELFFGTVFDGLTLEMLRDFLDQGITLDELIQIAASTNMYSDEKAVLTTSWENVGGGRINRKYLNGLVAFCFDEELKFPNGATYHYATATEAKITGQAAAIVERYGESGVDNAQWWNGCQVAIWAVQAGCTDKDSASAFARSYCADRGITDAATVADYVHVVSSLVTETLGRSGTAYLYAAEDPANQRIVTFSPVWPNAEPTYPSPKYDTVSAQKEYTARRTHSISIDHKYAAITGESLAGAVFQIYEDGQLVGTITTNDEGHGSCSWTLQETASASVTHEYCSNYDKLDPDVKETFTGHTSRQDALEAAESEAAIQAQAEAEATADREHTITIQEVSAPDGFHLSDDSSQEILLSGDASHGITVENIPWQAQLTIDKVDGTTGERIPTETLFALYEWNGTTYEVSENYDIIRLKDGTYTVQGKYDAAEEGYLYYTQTNSGKFGLAEVAAPDNYIKDDAIWYFEITEDEQIFYGHNAAPDRYPINDATKFANEAMQEPLYDIVSATASHTATRTHQITIESKYAAITGESLSGAVFEIYEDGALKGRITTDADGKGSLSWQLSNTQSTAITKTYCTNYDQLTDEMKAAVTVYTSKADAMAAAEAEAAAKAQALADAAADQDRTVTIEEVTVPTGFLATSDSSQEITLSGNASEAVSIENIPWKAHFLIEKVDGTTGHRIFADTTFALHEWNGTAYQVSENYDIVRLEDGTYTVQGKYEAAEEGCLYYTQANQGRFGLAEVTAPDGYVLDEEIFYFQITEDGMTIYGRNAHPDSASLNNDTVFANQPVTGSIVITKQGEFLINAHREDTDTERSFFHTHFEYQQGYVAGASFQIYVREDIPAPDRPDTIAIYNDVKLVKDALIATITTDSSGVARLEDLPLGTYYIREATAGNGDFLLNPTIAEVTLAYAGQTVPVVVDQMTEYINVRQKILLTLTKRSLLQSEYRHLNTGETVPDVSEDPTLPGAVFGLYAAEDIHGFVIHAETGIVTKREDAMITADTLIERIITNEQGIAQFISDLPCGKYYVKELIPPVGYLASEERYLFDASYTGPDGDAVIQLSYDFYNEPVIGIFSKLDGADMRQLPGATLQVKDQDGNVVDQWVSDGTEHYIKHLALDTVYTMTEVTAPNGYVAASDIRFRLTQATDDDGKLLQEVIMWVESTEDAPENSPTQPTTVWTIAEEGKVVMVDQRIRLTVAKLDAENGALLANALLSLHRYTEDGETALVARWLTDGTAKVFERLLPGKYRLVEDAAPDGYYMALPIDFEVTADSTVQYVEMIDHRKPEPPTPADGSDTGDGSPLLLYCCLAAGAGVFLTFRKRFS